VEYITYMCDPFYEMNVGQDKSLWSCLLMLCILNLLNVWYNRYIQVEIEFQIEMIIIYVIARGEWHKDCAYDKI
jgi:hypothetical protein